MALPDPQPGLVISYAYLWRDEARRGQEEGTKDRPCVVVLAIQRHEGEKIVTVAPVTHRPPNDLGHGIELPAETKRRLGLDDQRSWVITTDLNRFFWPGPDLRSISRDRPTEFVYGALPRALTQRIVDQIIRHYREHLLKTTTRSE